MLVKKKKKILTCFERNTSLLAFIFSFITVVISAAASIPKLRTGIGMCVVVPTDDVLSAGALTQGEITAGIERRDLWRRNNVPVFTKICARHKTNIHKVIITLFKGNKMIVIAD